MNEAETRAEHIDPALAAAGWGVVKYPDAMGCVTNRGDRREARPTVLSAPLNAGPVGVV
jgi:type I restriction enzyme, R subunit